MTLFREHERFVLQEVVLKKQRLLLPFRNPATHILQPVLLRRVEHIEVDIHGLRHHAFEKTDIRSRHGRGAKDSHLTAVIADNRRDALRIDLLHGAKQCRVGTGVVLDHTPPHLSLPVTGISPILPALEHIATVDLVIVEQCRQPASQLKPPTWRGFVAQVRFDLRKSRLTGNDVLQQAIDPPLQAGDGIWVMARLAVAGFGSGCGRNQQAVHPGVHKRVEQLKFAVRQHAPMPSGPFVNKVMPQPRLHHRTVGDNTAGNHGPGPLLPVQGIKHRAGQRLQPVPPMYVKLCHVRKYPSPRNTCQPTATYHQQTRECFSGVATTISCQDGQ